MSGYDCIIIGSGIAGLYVSFLLSKEKKRVLLLTKGGLQDANTSYAQGGIAAAIGTDDSPAEHLRDTLRAGAGLADPEAARVLCYEAPERISELLALGVPFDKDNGALSLAREGGHSRARVLHAGGDASGHAIHQALYTAAREAGVEMLEHHLVTSIEIEGGRAVGATAFDCRSSNRPAEKSFSAPLVIIATGGAGQLFLYNTNPPVATGDGVALGFRAGALVADLEFFQFHPTAFYCPPAPCFLISEAVRGEGAVLRDSRGRAFMRDVHPMADLAPRDVVARAIKTRMLEEGSEHLYLDATCLPQERFKQRFPQIWAFCIEHGVDPSRDWIPVAPAAHYLIGGIWTNLWGETTVPGLFACGEAAATGAHGANRLASNSLLEALVFGRRIARRILAGPDLTAWQVGPPANMKIALFKEDGRRAGGRALSLKELQKLMWDNAGLLRSAQSLESADAELSRATISSGGLRQQIELSNLLLLGRLLIKAALARCESRGVHYRLDYPEPAEASSRFGFCQDHLFARGSAESLSALRMLR